MFRKLMGVLPLLAFVGLAACEDGTTGPRGDGNTRMTVLLTDAPGDFEEAVVTITSITLKGETDVELLDGPWTGDLLELRNEVAMVAQGVELPAGRYSDLRLVVSGGYLQVEGPNGESRIYASSPNYAGLPPGATVYGDLQMPSFAQSGLKVKLPGDMLEVAEGGETVVMIDFDVAESFGHQAGKSGKWVMHPVIKATNVTFGGNVLAELALGQGVVLPSLAGTLLTLADFDVQLTPVGGGTARTGTLVDSNGDGVFELMFKGLVPGQYSLNVVSPTGLIVSFGSVLPITITVNERQTSTERITISFAAPASTVNATLALNAGVTLPLVGGNATTLTQFQAKVTQAGRPDQVVSFAATGTAGVFGASFAVPAGDYSLTLLAPPGVTATFNPTVPVNATVAAGVTATHAFTITAASGS